MASVYEMMKIADRQLGIPDNNRFGENPLDQENKRLANDRLRMQNAEYPVERQQKELENKQKLFDMYKTLRSNGYDSKTAHKATLAQMGVPEPKTEWTPDEEATANYRNKMGDRRLATDSGTSKSILNWLSGFGGGNQEIQGQMEQVAPRSMGVTGDGGQVLAPAGAQFQDGQILDQQGNRLGDYLQGNEPQPNVDVMRETMKKEIMEDPFKRKALGIPEDKIERRNFQDTTKLRQEFINRPEVKNYRLLSTQVNKMDAMLAEAKRGSKPNQVGVDQALITLFNKLSDPQSVVRESEYARTPMNLPMVNTMVGAIEKIKRGGAGLTNKDREALVMAAKIMFGEESKAYENTTQEYSVIADKYGMDKELLRLSPAKSNSSGRFTIEEVK